jgi:hypothetical protein
VFVWRSFFLSGLRFSLRAVLKTLFAKGDGVILFLLMISCSRAPALLKSELERRCQVTFYEKMKKGALGVLRVDWST